MLKSTGSSGSSAFTYLIGKTSFEKLRELVIDIEFVSRPRFAVFGLIHPAECFGRWIACSFGVNKAADVVALAGSANASSIAEFHNQLATAFDDDI